MAMSKWRPIYYSALEVYVIHIAFHLFSTKNLRAHFSNFSDHFYQVNMALKTILVDIPRIYPHGPNSSLKEDAYPH
jgi:hypothetical protein